MDKCCVSCIWNDCGLCDRTGFRVEDEDKCTAWTNHQPSD